MTDKQQSKISRNVRAVGVIPARYQASRFPGKVLADLGGMTVIERVYRGAQTARLLAAVYVATDDRRIARTVENFGGKVFMTSSSPRSGTERIAQVCSEEAILSPADIVVNIQGDEPFIRGNCIDQVVSELALDPEAAAVTLQKRIESEEEINDPDIVKVVTDRAGYALYFSRSPVPFFRDRLNVVVYKHIGLYGYRRWFLPIFQNLPVGRAERAESLEQLRILENGYKIKVRETDQETIGIDTPADLKKAFTFLKRG